MASPSKKVFIFGIDSFTGHYISENFKIKGYKVVGSSQKSSKHNSIYKLNLDKPNEIIQVLSQEKPDYIINLSAISFVQHKPEEEFYSVNVIGAENILKAVLSSGISLSKIILASSAIVYGNQNQTLLDESLIPQPINHYGISKYAMELMAKTYFDKLPIIITRPFNYTGIGQQSHFIIPKIISHFKEKKSIIELGNINTFREYNDVRWVAEVYLQLCLSHAESEVVNISSKKTYSIKDIIETCLSATNHKISVIQNPAFIRANEIQELKGSTNKLIELIGQLKVPQIYETLNWMLE